MFAFLCRCNLIVECHEFWNLGNHFCNNASPYNSLPQEIKQSIMSAFVRVGSAKMNIYKDKYWEQVCTVGVNCPNQPL